MVGVTTLHETNIDGVRCFWVDTGRPTLAASLLFRQGMCDEPLNESGWLHMLEHLSLHGRGGGTLHVNGSVSLLQTSFDAHGPAEAVASHLSDVSRWLAAPRFEDFEKERGVLRAESAGRGGPALRALGWRFGARGPGVCTYAEPGMGRATPEALAERAGRVFTSANAVLVLDGPPPTSLTLGLPLGEFLPPPAAVPCEDTLPAAYVDEGGVTISGLVGRSQTATIVPSLFERMLRDKLRHDAGAAYAPWSQYQAVDGEKAVIVAGSDVNAELGETLVPVVLGALKELSDNGVPAEHLKDQIESMVQGVSDPYNAFGLAFRAANSALLGDEPETFEEIVAAIRAVNAESIATPMEQFAASMMLGIPGRTTWKDELPMLRIRPDQTLSPSKRFRHQDWPASGLVLAADDTDVTISNGEVLRSMRLAEIEAMFAYEDGGRYLVSSDGWTLGLEFDEWRGGGGARTIIDAAVPSERTLPMPIRSYPTSDTRMPALKRWWKGLGRLMVSPAGFWIGVVFWSAILLAGVLTTTPHLIFLPIVWIAVLSYQRDKARKASHSHST